MDISKTNDVNLLKSMAYDAIAAKEQAESNLQMLNARIAQIQSSQPDEKAAQDKARPKSE